MATDFEDLLSAENPEEERDDQRGQPSTQELMRAALTPNPASAPTQQATEVQPPEMKDLLRQSSGVPSGVPKVIAAAPPTVPPPSVGSVVPPSPATAPAGVMRSPNLAPAEVPQPPTGAGNQRRMDLLKQMGTLEKPTDPRAVDASGKPMYRMSLGQRILGTVGNFATGFGTRGQGPTTYVGPGATNTRFSQDEDMREKTLAGVNEELGGQEKLDNTENKIYEDAVKQAYEGQLGDYRTKLGEAAEHNADTRGQLATSTAELNQTKGDLNEAKSNRDPIGQRIADADRQGLKGEDRKYYIANGKLKEGSDRAPSELEQWSAAFQRDNGRAPTADEIANRKSRGSTLSDKIEKDKNTALQTAEAKATARIDKLMKGMFITDPNDQSPRFSQAKQGIYADLQKEKDQIQQEYETRAKQNASARPAAPNARSAPNAPNAPNVTSPSGARVSGKYLGPDDPKHNLKKGQTVTLPQSQVQAAIKAGTFQKQ